VFLQPCRDVDRESAEKMEFILDQLSVACRHRATCAMTGRLTLSIVFDGGVVERFQFTEETQFTDLPRRHEARKIAPPT
jgi:hypothetical protein